VDEMPTLNEAKDKVIDLAKRFGWGISREHVGTKIFYAIIELGEAGDAWKHRGDKEWLKRELNVSTDEELTTHVAEEFIDTIFYCLNGLYCLDPALDVDEAFDRKWQINLARGRTYVDDYEGLTPASHGE
jgi:NTP pyrophosphatase (non-canonical NTP hydrolase)